MCCFMEASNLCGFILVFVYCVEYLSTIYAYCALQHQIIVPRIAKVLLLTFNYIDFN